MSNYSFLNNEGITTSFNTVPFYKTGPRDELIMLDACHFKLILQCNWCIFTIQCAINQIIEKQTSGAPEGLGLRG